MCVWQMSKSYLFSVLGYRYNGNMAGCTLPKSDMDTQNDEKVTLLNMASFSIFCVSIR